MDILENVDISYPDKLEKIRAILRTTVDDAILFQEMDISVFSAMVEISHCEFDCESKKYCLMKTDDSGKCSLLMPKRNLHMEMDNEVLYYSRISDELIRYQRIRAFILEPKQFLNLANIEYKINSDEILVLESFLKTEYLSDTVVFDSNRYVQNITHEIAVPDAKKSQKYSNVFELEE
jgi:hypothetical protein